MAAIQVTIERRQLKALEEELVALVAKLTPEQAELAAVRIIDAIRDTDEPNQPGVLGKALAALPVELTPEQAELAVDRVVNATRGTYVSFKLRALGEALAILATKLSDNQVFVALVFEILKYPNIGESFESTSVEDILLDATRKRFKDKGIPGKDEGFWEMVKWTNEEFPYLRLNSPPKVREIKKPMEKQG